MPRRSTLPAFVVILTVWSAPPADAQCGCPDIATCRGFLGSDFVFTATVSGIRAGVPLVDPDGNPLDLNERLVTLAVGDVFRGIVPATVNITVIGECDPSFEMGKEYLVYGTSLQDVNTGRVRISIDGCSRTRLLADADADLTVIRSLSGPQPAASLYGEISPNDPIDAFIDDAPTYVIGLRGNGRRQELRSKGGLYEFNFLQPGSYQLTITRGQDFELRLTARLDQQACFEAGSIRVP